MLTKPATDKDEDAISDAFYYLCVFAGFVISFMISLMYTDWFTAFIIGICLADILGFAIMIAIIDLGSWLSSSFYRA